MTIETKFDVGDEVWVINDLGKAIQFTVNTITSVTSRGLPTPEGYPEAHNVDRYHSACYATDEGFPEDRVFKTKQELIDSL